MKENASNNIPWDLISEAVVHGLPAEEKRLLQQWLDADPLNRQLFERISHAWSTDMEEYSLYQQADEEKAWSLLQNQIAPNTRPQTVLSVVRRVPAIKRVAIWTSVAASILVAVLILFFMYDHLQPITYATASGEVKYILLPDGSKVKLDPSTQMEVASDFNKTNRTVILKTGKAHFDVQHQPLPFIVSMESAFIRDIGTSFTIEKNKDSISVNVNEGKIVFKQTNGNASRELIKGMSASYNIRENNFSPVTKKSNAVSLKFANAALEEVIQQLEQAYEKKIVLRDASITGKKLTADLNGLSFKEAMQIVVASLHLQYKEAADTVVIGASTNLPTN